MIDFDGPSPCKGKLVEFSFVIHPLISRDVCIYASQMLSMTRNSLAEFINLLYQIVYSNPLIITELSDGICALCCLFTSLGKTSGLMDLEVV